MVHHFPDRANRCACWATRPTVSPTSRARDARPSAGRSANPRRDYGTRLQASELLALVHAQGSRSCASPICHPSPSSKTRYLVKRLRAALPGVRILVGRWGPPALADESTQVLRDTGANLVASTLLETRACLAELVRSRGFPFRRQTSRTLRSRLARRRRSTVWWRMRVSSTAQTFVRVCSMLCG